MVLVLVIGDFHIPFRAADVPPKFRKLLVPGKIQHIICTGNLCTKETAEYLKTVAADATIVRGDFDDNASLPESRVITVGNFRIGVTHGHQIVPWEDVESVAMMQRKLDVDIMITGFTHKLNTTIFNGKLFVNPGSATGAYAPGMGSQGSVPSFVLLDIQGSKVKGYLYKLVDDEVSVEAIDYEKPQ